MKGHTSSAAAEKFTLSSCLKELDHSILLIYF